jgi:hypothetical protein
MMVMGLMWFVLGAVSLHKEEMLDYGIKLREQAKAFFVLGLSFIGSGVVFSNAVNPAVGAQRDS